MLNIFCLKINRVLNRIYVNMYENPNLNQLVNGSSTK